MRSRTLARYYDVVHAEKTDDVDFYVSLAREEAGPVCELGAGTGRIAIPVARTGEQVTAVDLDPEMLARFRDRLATEDLPITLEEGDMRTWAPAGLNAGGAFGQVFIPFRVFLHNLTREERHACLLNCRRLLRPGGRVALNVFNPSLTYMSRYSGAGAGSWDDLDVYATPEGGRLHMAQTSSYDVVNKVLTARFRWREELAHGGWHNVEESFQLAFLYRDELILHVEAAGLVVEHVWGGFDRRPLERETDEIVITARRPL